MSDDDSDVQRYLEKVTPEKRRRDAETLIDLMSRVTGLAPSMRGTIVGFGEYHYHYPSGRQGDAPATGFAPRKAATVIYLPDGIGAHEQRLQRLGPHTNGVGCLYLKDLDAIDLGVLEEIIDISFHTVTRAAFGTRARDGQPEGTGIS